MSDVKFSLVITNYNRAEFLARSIRSCLLQLILHQKIEVLIVDDGSTDGSKAVLNEFIDEVNIISLEKNQGVAAASNVGLKHAKGKYWMRVDADDYLSMHACAFMGAVLDNNDDIGFVFGDHIRLADDGTSKLLVSLADEETLFEHGAGVLFRTEILRSLGGYDECLLNCEDRDLLYRMKRSGVVGYHIPVPLYRYYIHGKNISQNVDRRYYKEIVETKNEV